MADDPDPTDPVPAATHARRSTTRRRGHDDDARNTPPLEPHEKQKADEEEQLNVGVTYEVIRRMGEDELRRPGSALAWSGLAAGLSMGFSMLVLSLLAAHLPEAPWRPLVSKLGYSVGFLVVILGSQQLYTENTLTAVIPVLARRSRHAFRNMLRLWVVVLIANLAGALLFALVIGIDGLFTPETVRAFEHAAHEALSRNMLHTFILAIFAGWLIALMVWMLPAAQSLETVVIIIVTYVVGIGSFPHIIAGAVEVFYAGSEGLASWSEITGGYLVPTLLGNTLGGVALVAGLAHAQVASGGGKE